MTQATRSDPRVPVTMLTGYLGSGKTTLLNRILSELHGKRIAVIENEFGEIGIDQQLIAGVDEEVVEMTNGCLCCTVRDDLVRTLARLMRRRDRFDGILIETTGLADPSPVAQTLMLDDELRRELRLDAIVTLVDARHIWQHLDESSEAQQQIAFADVILLNKIDLASQEGLERLEIRLREMNNLAEILWVDHADVPLDRILEVGGFNLDRALALDAAFLSPKFPFEWAAIYELAPGSYDLAVESASERPLNLALLAVGCNDPETLAKVEQEAVGLFTSGGRALQKDKALVPSRRLYRVAAPAAHTLLPIRISTAGCYALALEHHPGEFGVHLERNGAVVHPTASREYAHEHEHDATVASVGIRLEGDLDPGRLSAWLNELLLMRGDEIFRMKGIFSIRGSDARFVFQGVHGTFDGRPDRPWGTEARSSAMIFIGRNLDRGELQSGLETCLA